MQSSAALLLAARGDIAPFDAAIFADTGWEPAAVYTQLDRLEDIAAGAGIPIVRVSAGNIRRDALDPQHRFASMPLFTLGPHGERGMARRQCTSEYKIKPIKVEVRRRLGYPHPQLCGCLPYLSLVGDSCHRRWPLLADGLTDRRRGDRLPRATTLRSAGRSRRGIRMDEHEHLLGRHLDVFRAVIEGRLEPAEWLAWWDRHGHEVKAAISPGMFLRIKPRPYVLRDPAGPAGAAMGGQALACHVLEQLGVAYELSTRYADEHVAINERIRRELDAAAKARAATYLPVIKSLGDRFPRFARYLKSHLDEIDVCEPGIDDVRLVALEQELGLRLPEEYRQFLRCARALEVSTTLQMTSMHPDIVDPAHPAAAGLLCIAEYWLESDGDQAMLDLRDDPGDDPPVLYYYHGDGSMRTIAPSFTAWVEALPRALTS